MRYHSVSEKHAVSGACLKSPLPRVGRLDSLPRVRRELARVYADARQSRLDPQAASRLANVLAILGRLIEGGELEARLAELEQKALQR
jgi:hypothetical protein